MFARHEPDLKELNPRPRPTRCRNDRRDTSTERRQIEVDPVFRTSS